MFDSLTGKQFGHMRIKFVEDSKDLNDTVQPIKDVTQRTFEVSNGKGGGNTSKIFFCVIDI